MSFLIAGLLTLIFGIISLINSVKYFRRNNPSGEMNFEDFKAWFGIGVAAIWVLLLMMLLFGA